MNRTLVVLCASAVLVLGGVLIVRAAGGGFLGGPGESDSTSFDASSYFGQTGQNLSVRRGTFVFVPVDGEPFEQAATILNVFGSQGFSCYRIPESDFTISEDLTSARLQTTVSGPNNCGSAVFQATAGGAANHVFTDGVALAEPLQLDVEWANIGAINTFTSSYGNTCLDFVSQTDSTGQSVSARARGVIAPVSRFASAPRLASSSARMSNDHSHTSVNSNYPFACT